MASRLANNVNQTRCGRCGSFTTIDYVGEYTIRYHCGCSGAATGCTTVSKSEL